MTKKEKAQALCLALEDEARSLPERMAAAKELCDLKAQAKVSYEKLGVDWPSLEHRLKWLQGQDPELYDAAFQPAHVGGEPFEATEEELAMQKGRAKEVDPLEEAVMPEQVAKKPEAVAKAKDALDRGQITALTKALLLADDAPYADIVAAVKARYPDANTTTRSVASVASEMRKAKEPVAMRRRAAK